MSTTEAQTEFRRVLAPGRMRSAAEPSHRRFRSSGAAEAPAKPLACEPAYDAVEDACKNVLASWSLAKAAILFGSRARGDCRADSDWDVAFVTSKAAALPDAILQDLEDLETRQQIVAHGRSISQAEFNDGANSLGNIAAPIAREGQLIAGHCGWPKALSDPILKPREYLQWWSSALRHIASASRNFAMAIEYARDGEDLLHFGDFIANSSDAAEFCAKIVFYRLASGTGTKILTHRVKDIVGKLDSVLTQHGGPSAAWWKSDQGQQIKELLRKMNGHGREHHQYGYPAPTPDAEEIAHAVHRLIATAKLASLEVEDLPGPGNLRNVAAKAAREWSAVLGSARRLRETLQDINLNAQTFAAANPVLAESALAAARFGEEVARAVERLADSLYAEMGPEYRAAANPVLCVVGRRADGRPLAISDDAEAIMDRADKISNSMQPRVGAGVELLDFTGFQRSLSTLGFASEPPPRAFAESEAIKLVENQRANDSDESELRGALAKLLRDRQGIQR